MKVREETAFIESTQQVEIQAYSFKCPGCGHKHSINVNANYHTTRWGFNGNVDNPTFTPSLLASAGHYVTNEKPEDCWICQNGKKACYICHSFITDGKIQFLGDCTHALAGQTIDLPEIEL